MHFRINGQALSARLEPRVTLLDALRARFELTGAKRVCDRGTCGACTVLLGGKAVYACSILAIDAQEAEIRTVESFGTVERLHPLQAPSSRTTPSSAASARPASSWRRKRSSTAIRIRRSPRFITASRNFCRCGTYAGIRRAVLHLAEAGAANPDFAPGLPGAPDPGEAPAPRPGRRRNKNKRKKKRPGGERDGRQ